MNLADLKFIRNQEWRVGLTFASSSVFSGIISMIIGILMIRWIEPGHLGIWQSLSILQLYIPFLEMGVPNGLNRELPFLVGRGEEAKAQRYAQTAQYFMIVISIILLVATIVVSGILTLLLFDSKIVFGVLTVGLMVGVNAYQRYLTVTYRSAQSFISLSKLYIYQTATQIILCPLVFYFEYYGLLVYSLLVQLVFTAVMHLHRPLKVRPEFNLDYFTVLRKTGIPVFAMGYLRGVSSSFSRVVLLIKSGTLSVGLFTPVAAVGTLISMLPGVLANYFFPKMNHQLGASNDPKTLWPLVVRINLIFLGSAVPFIVAMWLTVPFLVRTYFESYVEAIPAMQIFALNFLFAGTTVSHNAIYSVKDYTIGYIFSAAEFSLRFVCPLLLVSALSGNVLTLTAYGALLSNALLFVLNIILIRKSLFRT